LRLKIPLELRPKAHHIVTSPRCAMQEASMV
jgi:hypothetical protein